MAASGYDCKLPTGLALEIPPGYVGLVFPRSSTREKFDYFHHGVLDPDYRGEAHICFRPTRSFIVEVGQRIAQLVVVACPRFDIVDAPELSETARGEKGFGSTNVR
jgi:dUTP pyrophosphatase